MTSRAFAGLGSTFSAEDFFDVGDAPEATLGDKFRNSAKGYEFEAGSRRWRVVRDNIGFQRRLVVPADKRDDEQAYFAEWVEGVIVIGNLSKRGEYRMVGRPIVREALK